MSNEESMAAAAVASRRVPRQGVGGSPVGSTLSIVLAVVAVIAGFLILRNITDTGDSGGAATDPGAGVDAGADTTLAPDATVTETTVPEVTTPTTQPKVTEGATVVVANANTVGGSAGAMSKSLDLEGYTMGEAVNATGPNVDDTLVYYDGTVAAALDVANSVARDLGGVAVLPVPTPPPTESGSLDGAGVLVLLGNNQAGRTIEELSASADTTEVATAEAPAVAGTDEATTVPEDAAEDGATEDGATED